MNSIIRQIGFIDDGQLMAKTKLDQTKQKILESLSRFV